MGTHDKHVHVAFGYMELREVSIRYCLHVLDFGLKRLCSETFVQWNLVTVVMLEVHTLCNALCTLFY